MAEPLIARPIVRSRLGDEDAADDAVAEREVAGLGLGLQCSDDVVTQTVAKSRQNAEGMPTFVLARARGKGLCRSQPHLERQVRDQRVVRPRSVVLPEAERLAELANLLIATAGGRKDGAEDNESRVVADAGGAERLAGGRLRCIEREVVLDANRGLGDCGTLVDAAERDEAVAAVRRIAGELDVTARPR